MWTFINFHEFFLENIISFYHSQIDISAQNLLNIETDKVLYNFYVSHASLNSNWLATAEILDDHEHTIESRLKFWAFDEQKQAYKLNTQIELPHENGVRCLEFSSPHSIDNLLCATSGELDVKIWSLEDSANFKSKSILFYSNFVSETHGYFDAIFVCLFLF